MVAIPAFTPLAKPEVELIVAVELLLLDQVKDTFCIVVPYEVAAVALNCSVSPSSIEAVDGDTSTLEITGLTVSVAVSDSPPERAVIVTFVGVPPALTLVVNPEDELTIAADVLPLSHVKLTPEIATLYDV